ncbi:hypothetical protein ACL02O_31570 [Micromonospora sp. MS34]|uniref:hypothetical protein n=1 Tax=Micromonospora sp. MS34 TaxID=3385971 RepID=UPI00399F455A
MKFRRFVATAIASGVMAAGAVAVASPAMASIAPSGCTYSRTLNDTHIIWNGATAATVRQMLGYCSGQPRNWTYVWVWDSFKSTHSNFYVEAAINTTFVQLGWDLGLANQQEVTSKPTDTYYECTSGWARLNWAGYSATAKTSQVC